MTLRYRHVAQREASTYEVLVDGAVVATLHKVAPLGTFWRVSVRGGLHYFGTYRAARRWLREQAESLAGVPS